MAGGGGGDHCRDCRHGWRLAEVCMAHGRPWAEARRAGRCPWFERRRKHDGPEERTSK